MPVYLPDIALKKLPLFEYFQWMEPSPCLAARKTWLLATHGYAGERRSKLLKEQLRWAFSAAINAKAALGWFDYLQCPEFGRYTGLNRQLPLKPLRVYLSNKWRIERKIKILKDTYTFIELSGSPLQEALIRPDGIRLAEVSLPKSPDMYVRLGFDNRYRKEGELVISLTCDALGGSVVALSFSFEQLQGGEWVMYIGCVQGTSWIDVKPVTKAMHGLRPKAFIVNIAQEIACALGITHILGVGNAIHPHIHKRLIYVPSLHGISFDYDMLWEEMGGKLADEGWFDVPMQFKRRSFDDMKTNKRSMYVRRYSMLDTVFKQIRASLMMNG